MKQYIIFNKNHMIQYNLYNTISYHLIDILFRLQYCIIKFENESYDTILYHIIRYDIVSCDTKQYWIARRNIT